VAKRQNAPFFLFFLFARVQRFLTDCKYFDLICVEYVKHFWTSVLDTYSVVIAPVFVSAENFMDWMCCGRERERERTAMQRFRYECLTPSLLSSTSSLTCFFRNWEKVTTPWGWGLPEITGPGTGGQGPVAWHEKRNAGIFKKRNACRGSRPFAFWNAHLWLTLDYVKYHAFHLHYKNPEVFMYRRKGPRIDPSPT
jgi:hypothetical protein